MAWYDWLIGKKEEPAQSRPSTDQEDYDMGIQLLRIFHDRAKQYPNYKFTFEDLLNHIDNRPNIQKIKIQGIGLAYNIQDREFLPFEKAKQAMLTLADMGQGQVPSSYQAFSNILGKKAQEVSFIDAIKYTLTETAKDISEGVTNVGETIINVGEGLQSTAKVFKYIAPVIIIGGLIFILNKKFVKKVV